MDSGIIVFGNYTKTSHIFLCDNTPYDPSSSDYISGLVGDEHSLVSIFYPFNGAAQDYPLCYDSLSFADKKYLVEDRNKHRNLVIDRLSVALEPCVCIPYSSDFILNGPRSEQFLQIHSDSLGRDWSASSMRSLGSGVHYRSLQPGSSLNIDQQRNLSYIDIEPINSNGLQEYNFPQLRDEYLSQQPYLLKLVVASWKMCLSRLTRYKFSTKDLNIPFIIYSSDQKIAYQVYLDGRKEPTYFSKEYSGSLTEEYDQCLVLEAHDSYLIEWLERNIHFDNLCISCLLTWYRKTLKLS